MDSQPSSSNIALTSEGFNGFNSQLQAAALKATRSAVSLPLDIGFHRSIDPGFAKDIDRVSSRVINLANKLLNLVGTTGQPTSGRGKGKARLESYDDVVDNFHPLVVDSMDQLLERTDICLDEYFGRFKAAAISINPLAAGTAKRSKRQPPKGYLDPAIQHSSNLQKPQLSFRKKPDNSDIPWYPTLSHKFNAKVPLGHVDVDPSEVIDLDAGNVIANHPYRYEIIHIAHAPSLYKPCIPASPPALDTTPFTWINTAAALHAMLAKLKKAKEIAVDLEHHSYRSYAGFLCLMQISDREEDWIVDLLAGEVRDEIGILNEVFTDPGIVKVFHGAESDIMWLQQDFNIYIVNLFDTFHASKLLEFPRHGLANLLEMYCDYIPDKRYQLADWRIRPLPEEMLQYARSDTHFLLYVYDNLRNALLDRGKSRSRSQSPVSSISAPMPYFNDPTYTLLNTALLRSTETSLRVYQKELYDPENGTGSNGWDTLAKKWNKGALMAGGPGVGIGAMHREVYKGVHTWREKVAREEDESVRYVLPTHFLFLLADQPPADIAALLGVFRSNVPPVVRRRGKELLGVIKECVAQGLKLGKPMEENEVGDIEMVIVAGEQGKCVMQQVENPPLSKLWGKPSIDACVSSSSSLLFDRATTSLPNVQSLPTYISTSSSLFGNLAAKQKQTKSHVGDPHFKELVTRISSTFVIVPTASQITATARATTAEEMKLESPSVESASGMQVEIPYVPAAQRHTTKIEERDMIVVVGQARQKRKRTKSEAADRKAGDTRVEGSGKAKKAEHAAQESIQKQEPFDFAAVPNILDDNPDIEDGNRKKKQKKQAGKKGGIFYGDFPAPPKAISELKSGNQSHTFK